MLQDNVTIVFEVLDSVNDPHIIEYQEENLIMLDMIYNSTIYSKMPYEELTKFGSECDIEIKELVYIAKDLEEFKNIYEDTRKLDYQLNGNYIEGFVIEDSNQFMLKTKTNYYDTWKYLRTKMENVLKNNNFDTKAKLKLEDLFMKYLKEKYENRKADIKKINIITERNKFEKILKEKKN